MYVSNLKKCVIYVMEVAHFTCYVPLPYIAIMGALHSTKTCKTSETKQGQMVNFWSIGKRPMFIYLSYHFKW